MKTVEELAKEIVSREGGYVNDPSDPGGATKYGVTIGTMKALGIDLDKDGDVDIRDVQRLSMERAVEIYVKRYFYGANIHLLPLALQASVFDMNVNAGNNAAKLLQRLLTVMGFPCKDDGSIGPATAKAAADAEKKVGPLALADAYGMARRDYYYRLADGRPASRKYVRRKDGGKGGWITRAEEFISEPNRLTDAEHRARIARWA